MALGLLRNYYFSQTDRATVDAVWAKGQVIPGYSPEEWRLDACGSVIRYADHGRRDLKYGWEIDHIFPRALGGKLILANLQPLKWDSNVKKGDTYPFTCSML